MTGAAGPRVLLLAKTDFRAERDGGAQRTAAVVRALRARGLAVDVVAVRPATGSVPRPHGPLPARQVAAVGRLARELAAVGSASTAKWFPPASVAAVARLGAARPGYDVLVAEHSQLAPYRHLVPAPLVVDLHNVEADLMEHYRRTAGTALRRAVAGHEARALRRLEAALPTHADVLAVVSPGDADRVAELAAGRPRRATTVLAPNGVADACFVAESDRRDTVVFVAHLGWRPNVDAARWLVERVWPAVRERAPHLVLQLVGRSPAPEVRRLVRPGVELHADVDSTVPFVAAARVATAPLLAAGGTRLKILEALAVGTPVVATALGALGLEPLAGPDLRVVDDPSGFARELVAAADAAADRGRAAPRALVSGYRWESTLRALADAVDTAALGGGGRG